MVTKKQRRAQQRAALEREKQYCLFRPAEAPDRKQNLLNTTHVRCRPARGTSNLELGVYRLRNTELPLLDACREVRRILFNPKPRLYARSR